MAKKTTRGSASRAKAAKKSSKKSVKAVKKTVQKSPAGQPAAKKAAQRKKSSGTSAKKSRVTKKVERPAARKSTASKSAAKKSAAKKSLGRPRIPGDARLDLIFQKDYQAREVFEFLGVTTLRDLERFGPDEIIQKLTSPMVQTVGRIRKALAVANRSLADDAEFAIEFREQYMSGR